MPNSNITIEELFFQAAQRQGEEGASTGELVEATGRGTQFVRHMLRKLIDSGDMAMGWGFRADISGRQQRIPVYRVVKRRRK